MPSSSPCLILPIPPPPTTRQGSARVTKGSAGITKVIGLTKLRTKYKQCEAKPLNMPYFPSLPPHTTFETPQGSAGITKVIGLTKVRTKYKQCEAKPLNMPYFPSLPPHTTFETPQGSAGITKVIGLTKLRTKYKQYEAKRQLLGSYDLFLADIDIIHQLPPLIGTKFFKKKKHPIPVKLRGKEWAKSVREACDSTYLYVSGGPSMSVRAARFGMSEAEIVGNVMAVVAGAVEHVPKKWKNVSSLHIRATDSLALPIYMAEVDLPTKMAVKVVERQGEEEGVEREEGGGDKEVGKGKRRRGSTGGKVGGVKAKKPKVMKRRLST
ncbi:unnamed protein product [Closterium sp. Naga37s-1]|nr:unnamed protein product [Closterium sp. Naga37s-1]